MKRLLFSAVVVTLVIIFLLGSTLTSQAVGPYDDFSNPNIDPNKWIESAYVSADMVREIQNGQLFMELTSYVPILDNNLSFKNPAAINYIESDVIINQIYGLYTNDSSTCPLPFANIQGVFYNDGTGSPGSRLGDIHGSLKIASYGGQLVADWDILKFDDANNMTQVGYGTFNIPILVGRTYKLSIQWDAVTKTYTFGIDNLRQSWVAPSAVYPPTNPWKALRTIVQAPDPNHWAMISASFDNVVVGEASSSVSVGYNLQWLIITLVSLTLIGGYILRRRMNQA